MTESLRESFEKWARGSGWTDDLGFDRVDSDGEIADYDAADYGEKEYAATNHKLMWESYAAGAAAMKERAAQIAENIRPVFANDEPTIAEKIRSLEVT